MPYNNNNKEILNPDAFYEEIFLKSAAKELADSTPPSPLEPLEQRNKRSFLKVKQSFISWKEDLVHAGRLLDEAGFKSANLKNTKSSPYGFPESIKTCYDLLVATPQDFLEITPEEFGQIYSIACDHFEQKDFVGARDLFLLMATLNPRVAPPWLGIGMAEQHQGHHEEALIGFSQAIALDPGNPLPYLYIAKSLHLTNHTSEAIELLDELIKLCADSPESEKVKNSACSLKEECVGGT